MKRVILFSLLLLCCAGVMSQSEDFMQVYEACLFARRAMSDGEGSNAEIAHASELLNSAKWQYLRLFEVDVKGEANFGKTSMVFTPEYLHQFSEDKKLVNYKAKMYAEEKAARTRGSGSKVRLCTKCVGGGRTVTYKITQMGKTVDVAAVAEVNGMINLTVVVKDKNGKTVGEKKDHSDEFKGAASRNVHIDNLSKGENTVYITIENKYNKARSVAIIFE